MNCLTFLKKLSTWLSTSRRILRSSRYFIFGGLKVGSARWNIVQFIGVCEAHLADSAAIGCAVTVRQGCAVVLPPAGRRRALSRRRSPPAVQHLTDSGAVDAGVYPHRTHGWLQNTCGVSYRRRIPSREYVPARPAFAGLRSPVAPSSTRPRKSLRQPCWLSNLPRFFK